jgi:hypothetical protein
MAAEGRKRSFGSTEHAHTVRMGKSTIIEAGQAGMCPDVCDATMLTDARAQTKRLSVGLFYLSSTLTSPVAFAFGP